MGRDDDGLEAGAARQAQQFIAVGAVQMQIQQQQVDLLLSLLLRQGGQGLVHVVVQRQPGEPGAKMGAHLACEALRDQRFIFQYQYMHGAAGKVKVRRQPAACRSLA